MDIPLKKRPWFVRYRYYLLAALAFVTGCAMIVAGAVAIALSLKLRQLHDNVHTRYPGPDYGD